MIIVMKKTIFICICLTALSCKKSGTTLPTPSTKGYDSSWYNQVPNWKSGVTLIDVPYLPGNVVDSMVTNVIGDTAIVNYRGQKLYLWVYSPNYSDSVGNIVGKIGPDYFNNNTAYSSVIIYTSKYYDGQYNVKSWVNQDLQIIIDDLTRFNLQGEKDYFQK